MTSSSGGGVAYAAHIGGFISGVVLILFFNRKNKKKNYRNIVKKVNKKEDLGNNEFYHTFYNSYNCCSFVHEYGHYYFARRYGVGVTDFSIGFGKKFLGLMTKAEQDGNFV